MALSIMAVGQLKVSRVHPPRIIDFLDIAGFIYCNYIDNKIIRAIQ